MRIGLCVACKSRVEDGAVRCTSCGAPLDLPGAFPQVLGWVTIVFSALPLSICLVTLREGSFVFLIVGGIMLGLGITLVVSGKIKSRAVPARVQYEEDTAGGFGSRDGRIRSDRSTSTKVLADD